MKTFHFHSKSEVEGATGELRVLSRDGRWLPLHESVELPLPEPVELPLPEPVVVPGDAILQLVRRAKGGPATLESVLEAVRREWHSAA